MNHRADAASRTRSRQPLSASIGHQAYCSTISKNIQHILKSSTYNNNDTPSAAAAASAPLSLAVTPLVPGPYVAPPALRHLVPRQISLHPDDEPDHILAITFAILERAGNRAMSVKELGEAAYVQGYLRTSPSAAGQAIGTHIRNHMARHAEDPANALLSSYRLVGGQEDIRLSSALYCSTPGTCRKGTTVWYLSTAAGKPCPFETVAAGGVISGNNSMSTPPVMLLGTGNLTSLKRKIPPDDSAEFQRPNKIRITLRLPPRTPIAPRPRPIIPTPLRLNGLVDSSEEPSSDETDSSESSEEEEDDDDDDENMLDDFNSLLADDIPIAIPCAHRSGPAAPFCLSQPFFDTCEPPPDSEDDDDDFHHSMLRPDMDEEDALNLKSEEFIPEFDDIKEEDLAAIVLHELTASPEPSAAEPGAPMTARPELEWSALKIEEGVFSPMDILGAPAAADSPAASLDLDDLDLTSASVPSPTSFPPFDAPHRRDSSSILSVPPPTPWIKTEDENFMFERHSPELHAHDNGEFTSPLMSVVPISSGISIRPWENNDWTSVSAASASALVPGPESVSTDDVDFFDDDMDIPSDNRIKASTSAPALPHAAPRRIGGGKPLRLSIGGPATFHGITSSARAGHGHIRRHSHAAGTSASNRRLSMISTAFSDWTSGTPEDPDAPLVTPSHTGWRTYQWPLVAANANGSSSTLAHERIDEKEDAEEESTETPAAAAAAEEKKARGLQIPQPQQQPQHASTDEELNRVLMAPSFNQVLSKSLPTNVRISTLLLLDIPIFQCRLESPPMELIRRIDTDYVNISSIITYAKYLAQATPSRFRSAANPSHLRPTLPPPPTADELPPNHVFITSGARVINGGWVPLSTARALVKNYHDLPGFVRRVFLSDSLAEKFPPPIGYVRNMFVSRREKVEGNAPPSFGKQFAKPSSLSAHELLMHGGAAAAAAANGVPTTQVIVDAKGPVTARGVPLALNTGSPSTTACPPTAYPLSPVAALSSANALRAKHQAANSMQSLMALTNPLSSFNGWFGKAPTAMEKVAPLQPEEEEMLNAILKTPPKAKVDPRRPRTRGKVISSDLEDEDEGMSVDEKEEEEVVREVVDIGSDEEEEEEEKDDTVQLPRTGSANAKTTSKQTIVPRRSLRRMRSISSISSELTVSESESSAPPPSLDSRPAPKGKSTSRPTPPIQALTTINGNGRKRRSGDAPSVPLPARSEPGSAKRVKIIEVDEPADLGKPRRSIRTAKTDPAPPVANAPSPRGSKPEASSRKSAPPPATSASKPRRSAASVVEKDKEVDKEGPVLTRAGAAAAQKNAKRTLRSRA